MDATLRVRHKAQFGERINTDATASLLTDADANFWPACSFS